MVYKSYRFIKLALRSRTLDDFGITFAQNLDTLPVSSLAKEHFEPLIIQLEADEDLSSLKEFYLRGYNWYGDMEDEEVDSREWIQRSFYGLNYNEILEYDDKYKEGDREPPFYFPRNMNSFSVWINSRTKTYRVQP